jgi:biofilm PGA synthesis N-glycosyltransferase PgaC
MDLLDILVIFLLLPVVYCYLLYPYLVQVAAKRFFRSHIIDESYLPTISVILSAHNEELVIRSSIASILSQDYPSEKVEIIVGSDGSTDRTNVILAELSSKYNNIRTFIFEEQRGKMMTLNDIARQANGEILYFLDADITLSANSFRIHVRHYKDETVGVVGGSYQIHSHDEAGHFTSESEYASLEQRIRKSESLMSSTINVYGGNYSMRRYLWRDLPSPLVHDDVYVVLSSISQGKRVLTELESVAVDHYERSMKEEFKRKERSASRGYLTLSYFPEFTSLSGGTIALYLWSHKILRWLSPLFVFIASILFIINTLIMGDTVRYALVFTCLFGLIAVFIGYMLQKRGDNPSLLGKLGWFIYMNAAYIKGTFTYIFDRDQHTWVKATRVTSPQQSHH